MGKEFVLPATEDLVRLYADDVLRVTSYYLGKRCLAEDAFQDVFVKVLRKRDTFAGDCPPKFWLMAIARNVCKDYLKSSWSTRTGSYDQLTETEGEHTENKTTSSPNVRPSVDGREVEDLYFDTLNPEGDLWDAIQALDPVYKDVILLKYYCQMDNAAVARVCKITESSVRSRLFRARKKLAAFEDKNKTAKGETKYELSV
ncbi:MAG: sigma-70 family RNA polymerase sigma factor [Saccharofermentans sp.]|nr:sigma-70 family RNA polymerase sigma factor [Saccharofermentans sp.]